MGYIDIEDVGNVSQVGQIPLSEMADDEILDEMVRLIGETKMVDQHLEDHKTFPREEGWEIRARSARRHKVREFEELRAEAILRAIPNLPDIDPVREQARLERVAKWDRSSAAAERALRNDEAQAALKTKRLVERKAAMAAAVADEQKTKAQLFLKAAYAAMSKDQRTAIWDRAKEMFPDHPAWADWDKPAEEPRS